MERFQVVERGEGIRRAISRRLSAGGMGARGQVSERHPALLVISPRAAERGAELPPACRTVLLPGEAGTLLGRVRAANAVRYGLSPGDSLTLAGREGDRLWAALRRELVTVEGQVVERQEFPLTLPAGEEAMTALAVAGALLLLGVPPEALEQPGE